MKKTYDVAAYVWPAYTNDPLSLRFWPQGIGEWESTKDAKPKFEGHMQPRIPLWGYCDEADCRVMEHQIDQAVKHGVNVFIYDWYWYNNAPFLESCLNDGFLKAKNKDKMKFYLMWANHNVNGVWDKEISSGENLMKTIWDAKVNRQEFEKICKRIISKYFTEPNYYKIDNKPVFMFNDLFNLIDGLGGEEQCLDALNWFRLETVCAGFAGLHLQCTLRICEENLVCENLSGIKNDNSFYPKITIDKMQFDSLTHYQLIHFGKIEGNYEDLTNNSIEKMNRMPYNAPYLPHISIGWDNNPRYSKIFRPMIHDATPEKFKKALYWAKSYLDAHPSYPQLVTINSWNEWTEGSYLQPDNFFGYKYLEAVQQVFFNQSENKDF